MAKVRLVEWDNSFSVGIDIIDADHRKLADFIALMNAEFEANRSDRVVTIFEDFAAYLTDHSAREEEMLRQYLPAPEVDEHARLHGSGMDAVAKLSAELRANPDMATLQAAANFLRSWLKNHVFEHDLKIFRKIKSTEDDRRDD